MAPTATLVSRLKVQLKLSISRLRMVQQKDSALAKQQRRDMAQLLEQGRYESARIRVENIIRSDITTELHEILELYCELLLARSQLLLEPGTHSPPSSTSSPTTPIDPALEEAARSIIYAAPRTPVKELQAARALLVERFGKELALSAMEGVGVAERVRRKLCLDTPSPALVEAYLREIARFYGVPYGEEGEEGQGQGQGQGQGEGEGEDDDDEPADGEKLLAPAAPVAVETPVKPPPAVKELTTATPPREVGPGSPVRINPPSPSTENVAPRLRLPGIEERSAAAKGGEREVGVGVGGGEKKERERERKEKGPGGKIPDVDELAKRFAALKR